jgi:hypothetical protein
MGSLHTNLAAETHAAEGNMMMINVNDYGEVQQITKNASVKIRFKMELLFDFCQCHHTVTGRKP